jgi:hypothetical protein
LERARRHRFVFEICALSVLAIGVAIAGVTGPAALWLAATAPMLGIISVAVLGAVHELRVAASEIRIQETTVQELNRHGVRLAHTYSPLRRAEYHIRLRRITGHNETPFGLPVKS